MLSATEYNDLEKILNDYKEEIKRNKDLKKKYEELSKQKDVSFVERKRIEGYVKKYGNIVRDLEKILCSINSYKVDNVKPNFIPQDIKSGINLVLQKLDDDDKKNIEKLINESVKGSNNKILQEDKKIIIN